MAIVGFFLVKAEDLNVKETLERTSQLEDHLVIKEGAVKKRPTYFQLLCLLFKNKVFALLLRCTSFQF